MATLCGLGSIHAGRGIRAPPSLICRLDKGCSSICVQEGQQVHAGPLRSSIHVKEALSDMSPDMPQAEGAYRGADWLSSGGLLWVELSPWQRTVLLLACFQSVLQLIAMWWRQQRARTICSQTRIHPPACIRGKVANLLFSEFCTIVWQEACNVKAALGARKIATEAFCICVVRLPLTPCLPFHCKAARWPPLGPCRSTTPSSLSSQILPHRLEVWLTCTWHSHDLLHDPFDPHTTTLLLPAKQVASNLRELSAKEQASMPCKVCGKIYWECHTL